MLLVQAGCRTASEHRQDADLVAHGIIKQKTEQALGQAQPFSIDRPSDILRRRLLLEQDIIVANDISYGTDKLPPIDHWPEDQMEEIASGDPNILLEKDQPLKLSLIEALEVGARNSFEYQSQKEDVFREALALDLERNEFRNIFDAQVQSLISSDSTGEGTESGTVNSGGLGLSRKFANGAQVSASLAIDLANLLTGDKVSSRGLVGDATISIPLLRGSGKHIVTEPLAQAERNVIYAIYEFERFKKDFAVQAATEYLSVLQQIDELKNSEENYRSLIASSRRSKRLANAGRLQAIEVGQAVQNELRARERWIRTGETYKKRLDAFKLFLGLPPDALIELDRSELERLVELTSKKISSEVLEKISEEYDTDPSVGAPMDLERAELERQAELRSKKIGSQTRAKISEEYEAVPAADAPIELVEPSLEDAGPFEIDDVLAMQLALDNRLDLRVAQGKVYDAQRAVVVAADALRAELTLLGSAASGERRTVSGADLDDAQVRFDKARYLGLLTLDLPFERTEERDLYRNSFINLERSVRDTQGLEDSIKLSVINELRDLLRARESLYIQTKAVDVARKRVTSVNMFLEAGRAQIRDLLEAQESLLAAQNGFTGAIVDYRIAELKLQRDIGGLTVDSAGLWKEFDPRQMQE